MEIRGDHTMTNYTGDWHGLYRERWGDDLVPDAYAHPAKFARALIRRIYKHLLLEGYIKPGDTVMDPFGGVALGALDAMRNGLHWWGNELEEKFVKLGNQNIILWNKRYGSLWPDTWGSAVLTQGDSRELAGMRVEGVVSSPPYANRGLGDGDGPGASGERYGKWTITEKAYTAGNEYGTSPGQLAAMKEGELSAVVSSPPFGEGETRDRAPVQGGHVADCITRAYTQDKQGSTPGNLAHMKAVVSSPPYRGGGHHSGVFDTWGGEIGKTDTPAWSRLAKNSADNGYGQAEGQMEQMGKEDDFWTAARQIVDQCYLLLKPGAVAVWVVKRFVRDKQIVDFPDQWRRMCESAGFVTVEWIRAWVVEEHGEQMDLFGNSHTRGVERKSFFRRLYESKYPENSIDWEDVLIMRKVQV